MQPQIIVKNLKKTYKTHKREAGFVNALKSFIKRDYVIKHAVKGISFNIDAGERVALIGPNGAGKSSTVKMLTGILEPTDGNVSVFGVDPFKKRNKVVKNYGVIFGQKHNLWWDVPAIDSYYLYKAMYDISDEDFKKRLKIVKSSLGIMQYLKTPVRKLSLGERMRCELGLIFMHNPKLVFLDEPTIGVDVVGKKRISDFLLRINKKFNTTLLFTSHDMGDVDKICKRAIIINDGNVIFDGKISHLKKEYVDSKTVHLKFNKELNQKTMFDKEVKKIGTSTYKIVFEKDESVSAFLRKILADDSKDVVDIRIIETDLNEIIRNIFEGRK